MTRRIAASRISTEAVFIRQPYTLAPGKPCTGMGNGITSVRSRIRFGVSTRWISCNALHASSVSTGNP
ncbi:hypothetical protein D3C71_2027470 [compost metagenome]